MTNPKLTKRFLRLFIGSIVITALMGLYVIALPSENWDFEFKVIVTTLTIAAASVCGLACGGCLSRGWRFLPLAGLILTGLTACLTLVGTWLHNWPFGGNWEFWERYWLATAVLGCYAVACAHLAMLFLTNLASAYRWAYLVAYFLIFGLATVIAAAIVNEDLVEHESYWRLVGALSILVAAITLLMPVFHWLSREEVAAATAEADPLFAVEEEIARSQKRLIELENKRRLLLGRASAGPDDGPAR